MADWPVDAAAVGVVRWDPADARSRRARSGRDDRRCPTNLPLGVGHQAGHRARGARCRGGGHAGPRQPGGSAGVDGAPPAGPRVRARNGARAARRGPGARRIYSNAGYMAVAEALESASGMAYADYLAEGVLGPLGMSATGLVDTSVGGPAAGLAGPLTDLVALAHEWARPTLVSPATWRQATSVQFAGLAGVLPGFGPFDPVRLGSRGRGAGWQVAPLDGAVELAGHLRSLRPVRLVPVGRSGGRGALLRAGRPAVRRLGVPGVARPGRGGPGRVGDRDTGRTGGAVGAERTGRRNRTAPEPLRTTGPGHV